MWREKCDPSLRAAMDEAPAGELSVCVLTNTPEPKPGKGTYDLGLVKATTDELVELIKANGGTAIRPMRSFGLVYFRTTTDKLEGILSSPLVKNATTNQTRTLLR